MGDLSLEVQPKRMQTLEETASVPIIDLIKSGETDFVEFKSSLVWDYRNEQPSKEMKMVIARTVSSFMNSNGGILLIGVADDRTLLGLDQDLAQLHNSYDEFELTFTNAINTYLGKVNRAYVSLKFEKIDNKDVAVIQVKKSPHPVYLKCEGKKEEFCIRSGNSCQPLDISEANLYIKGHWADLR
jgi:predicted HTH transcriptional regulator